MVKPKTYGRLGNYLFQVACAASYAWKHDLEFTVPDTTNDHKWNPIYLQHLVNPKWDRKLQQTLIKATRFGHYELPWREVWRNTNIILDGYWQSEKFFVEYRPRILDAFGLEWKHISGRVAVHVRRGDYLTIQKGGMFKHPPVTKEWMEQAMALFPGYEFEFFSDDIMWCINNFEHRKDCLFSVGKTELRDLQEISWCEHQICSASTFSWWGMWLNRNLHKRAIFPQHWLTPEWNGGLDCSDIVPAWCTKL